MTEIPRFLPECTLTAFNDDLAKFIQYCTLLGFLFVEQTSGRLADIPIEPPQQNDLSKLELTALIKSFNIANNLNDADEFPAQHRMVITALKIALEDNINLLEIAKTEKNFRDMLIACQTSLGGKSQNMTLRKQRADISRLFAQATNPNEFISAIILAKRLNEELDARTDIPDDIQKGHTKDAFYVMILDQLPRLGFDLEKRRIDAEEDGYLDTSEKVLQHLRSLQASINNIVDTPIASNAMTASTQPLPAGKCDDDDKRILVSRRELLALFEEFKLHNTLSAPRGRESHCDGCEVTLVGAAAFREHRSSGKCSFKHCEEPGCPERKSHCTNRHDQCKQRKGDTFGVYANKAGIAIVQPLPFGFDFMSA